MKHALARCLMLLIAVTCLVLPCFGVAAQPGDKGTVDVSSMKDLVVMANGRMKPLTTHARESMRGLDHEIEVAGLTAFETYVAILCAPHTWHGVKWFVPGTDLSIQLFGEPDRKMSLAEISESYDKLRSLIDSTQGMDSAMQSGKKSPAMKALAEQAMSLINRAILLQNLLSDFYFFPLRENRQEEWVNIEELYAARDRGSSAAGLDKALTAFDSLKKAFIEGDAPRFTEAAAELKQLQRQNSKHVISSGMVRLENLYYAVDVNWIGLILFVICGALYLTLALTKDNPFIERLAFVVLILGIGWNFWIIGGRTAIGGRLPLKNLNEVYLVVLFAVPLIGLLLHRLLKSTMYSGLSAALCIIGFIGALNLKPEGYDISPLVAILISPWREVHILTIMLSYAVLLVAAGLHMTYLMVLMFQPNARIIKKGETGYSPLAEDLNRQSYYMVAWGFLLLTLGIATGAAWAHSSWGRYWGWDPKEVWATVAWAIYALFLHLRIFFRTRGEVLALINLVGLAAILFTYFGVTYLLSGIHSYS